MQQFSGPSNYLGSEIDDRKITKNSKQTKCDGENVKVNFKM